MANSKNLHVITSKLTQRVADTDDVPLKQDLVTKLLTLCERFREHFDWYLDTINKVLSRLLNAF